MEGKVCAFVLLTGKRLTTNWIGELFSLQSNFIWDILIYSNLRVYILTALSLWCLGISVSKTAYLGENC